MLKRFRFLLNFPFLRKHFFLSFRYSPPGHANSQLEQNFSITSLNHLWSINKQGMVSMGSPWASMAHRGYQNLAWTTTNFSYCISILAERIYAFPFDHHMQFRNDWAGIYWVTFMYAETWQQQVLFPLEWAQEICKQSNIGYAKFFQQHFQISTETICSKSWKNVSPGIYFFQYS